VFQPTPSKLVQTKMRKFQLFDSESSASESSDEDWDDSSYEHEEEEDEGLEFDVLETNKVSALRS
jgi:hypothetical protein